MALSRRKFLKAGTLVILSAGVPLKVVAGKSPDPLGSNLLSRSPLDDARSLTLAAFSAQLNTAFRVAAEGSKALSLELIEVNDLRTAAVKQSAAMVGRECFSTIFLGPRHLPLKQNAFAFEHRTLGKFNLLLVPIGYGKQGRLYEAVFNRLY